MDMKLQQHKSDDPNDHKLEVETKHSRLIYSWVGASSEPSSSRVSWLYYDPIHPNLEGAISKLNVSTRKMVLVRPRTSIGQTNLEESSGSVNEERIPEEEAVCMLCFGVVKDQENILKTKCKCKIALLHETCVIKFSGNKNCQVCRNEVKNLPVTLLWPSSPASNNSVKSKKKSPFSRYKRFFMLCAKVLIALSSLVSQIKCYEHCVCDILDYGCYHCKQCEVGSPRLTERMSISSYMQYLKLRIDTSSSV